MKLPLFFTKVSDMGPEPILSDLYPLTEQHSPEELESLLFRLSAGYFNVLGHYIYEYSGLFGPIPVMDLPDWLAYIFSFKVTDTSLEDPRLNKQANTLLTLFVHKNEQQTFNFMRYYFEVALKKIFSEITSIEQINEDLIRHVRDSLREVAQEFIIEEKSGMVTITKRVHKLVNATHVVSILERLKTRKKKFNALLTGTNSLSFLLYHLVMVLFDYLSLYNKKKKTASFYDNVIQIEFFEIQDALKQKSLRQYDGILLVFPSLPSLLTDEYKKLYKAWFQKISPNAPISFMLVVKDEDISKVEEKDDSPYSEFVEELSSFFPTEQLFSRPVNFFLVHPALEHKTLEPFNFLLENL